MGAWDWLIGSQDKLKQQSTRTPEQQQFFQQLMQGLQGGQSNIPGMEWLQSLFSGDPEAFSEYEAPAMRQFNEQVIPGIAERFTGSGAGSRNSSAFNNSTAMAGSRLSENLASQRANLRSGGMGQLQGWSGMAQQPQFENLFKQGQPGLLQGIGGGLGQGLGQGGMLSLLKMFGLM